MNNYSFRSLLITAVGFSLLLSACTAASDSAANKTTAAYEIISSESALHPNAAAAAADPASGISISLSVDMDPFTGEATDTTDQTLRPVAVVLGNSIWNTTLETVPIYGIEDAAFLCEYPLEEDNTGFLAVYSDISKVDVIGPVRAARSYSASIAMAFDAVYCHIGYSQTGEEYSSSVTDLMADGDDLDLNKNEGTGYRVDTEPYNNGIHSRRTTGTKILEWMNRNGTRLNFEEGYDLGLRFSENAAPQDGETAQFIRVLFPNEKLTEFTYDEESGGYILRQYNTDLCDGESDTPLSFTNLIVLNTDIQTGIDYKNHTSVVTYAENGAAVSGTGFFFCGGQCIPIRWERGGPDDVFRYSTEDGRSLVLGVGQTYLAFVGTNDDAIFYY